AAVAITLVAARNTSLAAGIVVAVSMAILTAATAVAESARELVIRMRRTPLRARNLDLGEFLMRPRGLEWLPVLLAGVAVAVSAGDGSDILAVVGSVVAGSLAVLPVAVLGLLLVRDHRAGLRQRATAAISEAVRRLAPQVVI